MTRLDRAYKLYRERQARMVHPDGKFDQQKRWYPADAETQDCCRAIRSPSRAYPYSYLVHCRTAEHVARLCEVEPAALKARIAAAQRREAAAAKRARERQSYWKLVARVDGRLLSIYDGATEYHVGRTMIQRARQDHGGGYYVYASQAEALQAEFPRDAKLRDAEKVLLRCHCAGSYCRYDNGKVAFGRVTPVEAVDIAKEVERVA